MEFYHVNSITKLAEKLKTSQSTISGWRSRNAIGALTSTVASIDEEALAHIFASRVETNNFQNSNNAGQLANKVEGNQISNPLNQNEGKINDEVDPATYNLFLEAYKKAIEENNLKSLRLHLMEY